MSGHMPIIVATERNGVILPFGKSEIVDAKSGMTAISLVRGADMAFRRMPAEDVREMCELMRQQCDGIIDDLEKLGVEQSKETE
ncbi:hypothetical protein OZX67_03915 [Bifidobacterium sp. ESL0728]|uniref:hypothetical protein n=1 Tax=Bifidobacterium sp. ESL0728 TaxID=2983220 RepID=UPI0023F8F3E5|nr:hypothetical protein [Bifidobacterium sp. ESL0728]WEV59694.1 hypothetical protein OZX67_03915 [Bifidobacterium sp. ESL0728]